MILSKTRRPEYNLLIDSNVIRESICCGNAGISCSQQTEFRKTYRKTMPARVILTSCIVMNKKTLNIKKVTALGNALWIPSLTMRL